MRYDELSQVVYVCTKNLFCVYTLREWEHQGE